MDARVLRLAALTPALFLLGATSSPAATYKTANFVVTAPTPDFAQQVAETAERYRNDLAREWLGYTLPRWFRPCQINVTVGQIGAGGATTFTFAAGQVFGWNMNVQGTPERILDSVIPHEVSHTIFASFFRRPLPRWADEGAASLVEHESERHRQLLLLQQVFNTPRRIPLTRLISMKDYPSDMQSVLTLYAEGYSLADYLVQSGGKSRYLNFLKDANEHDWNHAIQMCYGLPNVVSLERRWSDWVMAGSPELGDTNNQMIVEADARAMKKRGIVVRSQSPDNSSSSVDRLETSHAARPAKPLPVGDQLEAPRPAARGRRGVQTAERIDSDNDAAASAERLALRREGRERMLNDGWQPIRVGEGRVDAQPAREAKSGGRTERVGRPSEEADPFDETRGTTIERHVSEAQSPFHADNE